MIQERIEKSPKMSSQAAQLQVLNEKLQGCVRCALGQERTKIVFGEGSPNADIMIVGEAPGRNEDLQGRPFVGRSGKLLNEWLEKLGLSRESVYIANTVKCRPPGNRDPEPEEKTTCFPFLHTQIWIIKPKVLVALGRHAANSLAKKGFTMKKLRTSSLSYEHKKTDMKLPIVATYHPSYVLRCGRGPTEDVVMGDLRKALELTKAEDKQLMLF